MRISHQEEKLLQKTKSMWRVLKYIVLLNRFQTKYLGLSEQSHGSIQEDVKSAKSKTCWGNYWKPSQTRRNIWDDTDDTAAHRWAKILRLPHTSHSSQMRQKACSLHTTSSTKITQYTQHNVTEMTQHPNEPKTCSLAVGNQSTEKFHILVVESF